jgi:hypothetical protein
VPGRKSFGEETEDRRPTQRPIAHTARAVPGSLFDENAAGVTVKGYWLAFPQHTTFLVVETDDAANLQAFLRPGVGRCVAEITPLTDRPAA